MTSILARHGRRLLTLCAVTLATACGGDATGPASGIPVDSTSLAPRGVENAVLRWDDALCDAIRVALPGPTVVARAFAILHTATYDAWAPYDERALGTQLGATLRHPPADRTGANKDRAISYAAYRVLVDLFPAQKALFDERMAATGYDPRDDTVDPGSPAGVGNLVAAAILGARHRDGSNQLGDLHTGAYSDYTGYAPVNTPDVINDPSRWQPLRIPTASGDSVVQKFTTPHWNRVTPFALTFASQFRPTITPAELLGGPRDGTSRYERQVEQVVAYSAALDDRTKVIAEYWADGPQSELPPGHWCIFAGVVSRRDRHSVDDDARMFFAIGNAMLDASIAVWDSKRAFDSVRPVSAVRYLKAGTTIRAWGGPGKGTVLMRGEDWNPYQPVNVVTPPFPEYLSGHSAFSGAGAQVLRRFTGSDRFGATWRQSRGSSRVEPGLVPAQDLTLSWDTFTDAMNEAGFSRRYGGIHFEDADLISRDVGRKVGDLVWEKASRYWNGTI
jgi:hypothetical protein